MSDNKCTVGGASRYVTPEHVLLCLCLSDVCVHITIASVIKEHILFMRSRHKAP